MIRCHPENLIYDRRNRGKVAIQTIGMIANDRMIGFCRLLRADCSLRLMYMDMMAKVGVGRARFMLAIAHRSPPDELDWQQHQHD